MLSDRTQKVKGWIQTNKGELFTAAVIFFVGVSGFGLGRLSVLLPKKEPIRIEKVVDPLREAETASVLHSVDQLKGRYVGSRSGSVYHALGCPGAAKIKEENKIWFQTKEEAATRGYKPAANCPELQ